MLRSESGHLCDLKIVATKPDKFTQCVGVGVCVCVFLGIFFLIYKIISLPNRYSLLSSFQFVLFHFLA